MHLGDDDLLAFESTLYDRYEEGSARDRLTGPRADLYRGQLLAALLIDRWRERTLEHDMTTQSDTFDPQFKAGWEQAMREMVASLRQGDFAPGGTMYENDLRR